MKDDEIRKVVRERYAKIATGERSPRSASTVDADELQETAENARCCAPQQSTENASCCAPQQSAENASCCAPQQSAENASCCDTGSEGFDYTAEQLGAIPKGADLGLGCGNPTALASLAEGEVVLDLGSGGGVDCFIAANRVGKTGQAIGVDMTPEMIHRARENAEKGGYGNVEFRLGEIERLPVADNSVDIVISNCVINLSPNKGQVFKEAYRVLKPGGRVMVSDIVLLKELPETVRNSAEAIAGCVGGASIKDEYLAAVASAGFKNVEVISETSPVTTGELADTIVSANIRAVKPK